MLFSYFGLYLINIHGYGSSKIRVRGTFKVIILCIFINLAVFYPIFLYFKQYKGL